MSVGEMKDLRVLITGGARGVGREIAQLAAERGAVVGITGRTEAYGEKAVAELRSICPQTFFLAADSADESAVAAAVEEANQRMGGLDVLISSGGEGHVAPTPFSEIKLEDIRRDLEIRIMARITPVHVAIPYLRKSERAGIVMVTTDASRHPTPGESVIGGAGAAILLMTKTLARELSRDRIRVNGVAVTLTSDTPGWDRIFSKPSFQHRLFDKALSRFPSGRAPSAREVAEAAAFLSSPRASQITGQTISVNGGLSFGGW